MSKPITSNKAVTDMWSMTRMLIEEAVLAEREACARICEELDYIEDDGSVLTGEFWAQAIRARGQE
jgi:hypothetical protein